ncbi:S1 family peptidase [Lentzea sp. JNUCC 0626]|uniref:S1 family peptidase n=1 Tax=Lentzea sp. JNUCC 0626 TaxID=3367513 RepID=UPI0037489674
MNKVKLSTLFAITAMVGVGLSTPTAAASDYDSAMLTVLAAEFGTTPSQAAVRLDREQRLTAELDRLRAKGTQIDGAYFEGERLIVNTVAVGEAAAAGLTPRKSARGERALVRLSDQVVRTIGDDSAHVQSVGPDVAGDKVVVEVTDAASHSLVTKLSSIDGVTVKRGAKPLPQADVVPGRIMDMVPGTNCSLGFNGLRGTQKVVLTAGHCVRGNPDILDANGTHIGRGIAHRMPDFDMGLMSVDAEDTQRTYVDTRMNTTVRVTGMSRGPVGSAICKAGNTTGWTCGTITSYNNTVFYRGEVRQTGGLARATVCTEGGDSGGAYISGNTAQGMTSGGPVNGPDCGFNSGTRVQSYSFYQPIVDAANHYGVQLLTS